MSVQEAQDAAPAEPEAAAPAAVGVGGEPKFEIPGGLHNHSRHQAEICMDLGTVCILRDFSCSTPEEARCRYDNCTCHCFLAYINTVPVCPTFERKQKSNVFHDYSSAALLSAVAMWGRGTGKKGGKGTLGVGCQ